MCQFFKVVFHTEIPELVEHGLYSDDLSGGYYTTGVFFVAILLCL
jgi:hypothetical protein